MGTLLSMITLGINGTHLRNNTDEYKSCTAQMRDRLFSADMINNICALTTSLTPSIAEYAVSTDKE